MNESKVRIIEIRTFDAEGNETYEYNIDIPGSADATFISLENLLELQKTINLFVQHINDKKHG